LDILRAGKRTIALNLKKKKAISIVRQLCKISDVIIEPFRPGVMEKLGLGPDVLLADNPRLIYARLTGFGADGQGLYANRAGHDINYIATSGVLSMFGRKGEKPYSPVNYVADFAGGGLLCAFGICAALLERHNSNKGQIVDSAMVDGSAYIASWMFSSRSLPIWTGERGENLLDGGVHFYETYETKDGQFMAVGALEPQFYAELLKGLDLNESEAPQYGDFEKMKILFGNIFKTKTQSEWAGIFDTKDACVTPVVDWQDAPEYSHNKARQVFVDPVKAGRIVPNPAPKLSRTPAVSGYRRMEEDGLSLLDMTSEVLSEIGIDREDIGVLYEENVLMLSEKPKL
jgi:alpha-methylacyl-CoA racemase